MSSDDWLAVWVTLKLATTVTVLLLLIGLPLANWLAPQDTTFKRWVSILVTLPLVLPPTVLGFYLLILLGPNGWVGQLMQSTGLSLLPFTFSGLVVASVIYSIPFVVQPLQNVINQLDPRQLEVAATLGAGPVDRFLTIYLPIIKPGLLTAAVLGFAHTLGEFGVLLMIGGNIPGSTQVLSVLIYQHVETLNYQQAHILSLGMMVFAILLLILVNRWQRASVVLIKPVNHAR